MSACRNIIVAVTGASGAIYARLLLERLIANGEVKKIALVLSDNARKVIAHEGVSLPESEKIELYENNNMECSLASGSARWDSMVVVPSSSGTMCRIASGVSLSLIERAADVQIKEGRKLILVLRESPLSLIHARAMTTLCSAGVTILPASPSFYSLPSSIEELCGTIIERILRQLNLEGEYYCYTSPEGEGESFG